MCGFEPQPAQEFCSPLNVVLTASLSYNRHSSSAKMKKPFRRPNLLFLNLFSVANWSPAALSAVTLSHIEENSWFQWLASYEACDRSWRYRVLLLIQTPTTREHHCFIAAIRIVNRNPAGKIFSRRQGEDRNPHLHVFYLSSVVVSYAPHRKTSKGPSRCRKPLRHKDRRACWQGFCFAKKKKRFSASLRLVCSRSATRKKKMPASSDL